MSTGPGWRAALAAEIAPVLESLVRGDDVAPARHYRAEGFAQAIVALRIAGHGEVLEALRGLYAAVPGLALPVAADFEETDGVGRRRLRIPVWLPRAPVYPGTAST